LLIGWIQRYLWRANFLQTNLRSSCAQFVYLDLKFFQGDSQPSAGTLSHAKDLLNARNVKADPSSRYYDCAALFDKVFHAYMRIGK
jgi:hypothetical protein